MEEGVLSHPETGVVQGGVASPVLANIFLHHVLDEWFEREVQPRMQGRCFLIRFADDFVIGCEVEADARKIMAVLPEWFERFGLTIHPTKTALVSFRKPTGHKPAGMGNGTFDFLGFTHYWTKSRQGSWVIKQKTAKDRFSRATKRIGEWCREHRHEKVRDQHAALAVKLR